MNYNNGNRMDQIGSRNGKNKAENFVLIEGGPGMGKSTLCWQLCGLWREGKLQWDLMVIVELRDESTRRASSLYDLLYHPDDETRLAIEQDIKKREGEGLLIFLDGYDELSNEQQNELSVVHKILTNKLLRKATVVVTSRPHAIKRLPSQFKQGLNQHIEIAGFNETNIQLYIALAFGDSKNLSNDFRSYVDSHPFVLSVMYNPLHCSIVTELYIQYWQNGQKGFAPKTLTEVCNAFILNLLTHNLHTDLASAVKNLPKDVLSNLMQLAELAASGMKERRYIFRNVSYNMLGLMVSVRKLYDIRPDQPVSYTFLHLTIQEYLAALYWSCHPDQQPREFLDSQIIKCLSFNRLKDGHHEKHRPFCLFFAGLANITDFIEFDKIRRTIDQNHFYVPQMCELLFEAQSASSSFPPGSRTFKMPSIDYYNSYMNALSSPWESFTLAYCFIKISTNSTWTFTITEKVQLEKLADGMHSIGGTAWDETHGPTVRMRLSQNVNDTLESFPKFYPFTKLITILNLSGDLNDKGTLIMKNLSYYCPRLYSLLITRNSSRPSIANQFHLPPNVDLSNVSLYLPYDDLLFDNLHHYQTVEYLHLYPDTARYVSLNHPSFKNQINPLFLMQSDLWSRLHLFPITAILTKDT